MPATPPTIGVEFEWMSVADGDGGTLTLFATVVDVDGRFTVRAEQTGAATGLLVVSRLDGTVLREILIAPGSQVLIALQGGTSINVPFSEVAQRVQLLGGAR